MPKTPKPKPDETEDTWPNDQKEREYYYDDSHGYEDYDPACEEEEGSEGVGEKGRRGVGEKGSRGEGEKGSGGVEEWGSK